MDFTAQYAAASVGSVEEKIFCSDNSCQLISRKTSRKKFRRYGKFSQIIICGDQRNLRENFSVRWKM
jgi:hypothetical protein